MKDPKSPATSTDAYDRMVGRWMKIQSVLDGTEALRDGGKTFMPQHDNESDGTYKERKSVCTLLNLSKLTLDSWVGRPFSEPLVLNEDVPEKIRDLEDNIDLLGNGIGIFARNWFREGLAKGIAHAMIEMPRSSKVEGRTLADDRNEGLRPYWVHVAPESIFFADAIVVNGEEILTEIRMVEMVSKRDGFLLINIKQIRQMVLSEGEVSVTLWQEEEKKEGEWKVTEKFTFNMDRIPLVTFYADRAGLMEATPPLEDVVDLNLAHWQSTSDQRAALTVARFPMLVVTGGVDENGNMTVGPKKWLYSPDPNANFKYLEHSGLAIEAGRNDLKDLEASMADYGSEFLKRRPGRETATARTLDSAESTSSLQDVTLRFIDAMQTALAMTAKWMNLPEGGTIDLNTEFAPSAAQAEGLRVLIELRKLRDVSRDAMIMAMIKARVLPEDFDADADSLLLEDEGLNFGLAPDPDAGLPPEGDDDGEDDTAKAAGKS